MSQDTAIDSYKTSITTPIIEILTYRTGTGISFNTSNANIATKQRR